MTHKTTPTYNGEIFRKDHLMIFASNRHLASIKAINVTPAEAHTPGQIMARDDGDGVFKKFSAVSGGSYTSVCVLMDEVTTDEGDGSKAILRGIFSGELYKSALLDYNATALSDMGGKIVTDAQGDEILHF